MLKVLKIKVLFPYSTLWIKYLHSKIIKKLNLIRFPQVNHDNEDVLTSIDVIVHIVIAALKCQCIAIEYSKWALSIDFQNLNCKFGVLILFLSWNMCSNQVTKRQDYWLLLNILN